MRDAGYKEWVVHAAIATLLWTVLYRLNDWIFASIEVSSFVCWIFLPAAIRLLTVLVMGPAAAAGLMLGTFLTSNPIYGFNFIENASFSVLSGAGPLIAVAVCIRMLRLPNDLAGLSPLHLLVFSLIGAVCNVIPHTLLLLALGKIKDPYANAIPMFVGDITGTWIVLHLSATLLRHYPKRDL
jgi:hypothetical protein